MKKKCTTKWDRIVELEAGLDLSSDEEEELEVLKRSSSLVLAVDYQMSKLVPYWGQSPQSGSTYYLQKLSHDIFGVVNHATNDSTVYLLDKRVGPKNTNHTISYLTHYISQLPYLGFIVFMSSWITHALQTRIGIPWLGHWRWSDKKGWILFVFLF